MPTERYANSAAISAEWDELADRVQAVPWLRPGWIEAWWRAFGRGRLEIVALRRNGRLTAVCPLARRFGAVVSPTNWHTPQYGPLAEDADAMTELVASLWASSPRRIDLSFLPARDLELSACWSAARTRGYRALERVVLRSPYVQTDGEWEDHAARLNRHMLKEIARSRRRLAELGEVSFDLVDGSENLGRLLAEGFQVEHSGWKARQGTAIAADPRVRAFYRDVASWAATRGILRLAYLRLNGAPVAFDFNIEDNCVCHALKGGYDDRYRKFGPGMLLTHEMLQYAFRERLTRYDFVGQDEPFKTAWTDLHEDRIRFQACAPSPAGLVEYAALAYGKPLTKPIVERIWRRGWVRRAVRPTERQALQ